MLTAMILLEMFVCTAIVYKKGGFDNWPGMKRFDWYSPTPVGA